MMFFSVASPELQRRNSLEKQIEKLENDMSVLSQISSLTDSLNVSHQVRIILFIVLKVRPAWIKGNVHWNGSAEPLGSHA